MMFLCSFLIFLHACYVKATTQSHTMHVDPHCAHISKFKSTIKSVSNKNYVEAFTEGPCSPIILVPGYWGSKLQFEMKDPQMFKQHHKDIVDICGWKNVEAEELKKFSLWINVDIDIQKLLFMEGENKPKIKKEYIPHILKRVKVMEKDQKFPHKEGCYGSLLRNYFDVDENSNLVLKELKGAVIRPTLSKNDIKDCGRNSVSNFLESYSGFVKFTLGFDTMIKHLETLGYKLGLSLFVFPYDWRISIADQYDALDRTIKLAYAITKKKTILINHSLGGLISYNLSRQNSQLIEEVVSIATPFLGSTKIVGLFFEPDKTYDISKELNFLGIDVSIQVGIDEKSKKSMFASQINASVLLPKPRIKDEVDLQIQNVIPNLLGGQQSMMCNSKNNNGGGRQSSCNLDFKNFYDDGSIKLNGEIKKFTNEEELYRFLQSHKYFSSEESLGIVPKLTVDQFNQKLYNLGLKDTDFKYLSQPDVPFTFIYSSILPTASSFDVKSYSGKIKLSSTEQNMPGDGTIDTLSQIYPGLRWATQNQISGIKSKPIHFVEFCSSQVNIKQEIYDPKATQFLTIPCECLGKTGAPLEECNHSVMINDKHLVSFIEKMVKTKRSPPILVESFAKLFEKTFTDQLFCYNLRKLLN